MCVLRLAAEKAGWGSPRRLGVSAAWRWRRASTRSSRRSPRFRSRRGAPRGIASSARSIAAVVAVNPDNVRAQIEGASASASGGAEVAPDAGRRPRRRGQFRRLRGASDRGDAAGRGAYRAVDSQGPPASASRACRRSARQSPTLASGDAQACARDALQPAEGETPEASRRGGLEGCRTSFQASRVSRLGDVVPEVFSRRPASHPPPPAVTTVRASPAITRSCRCRRCRSHRWSLQLDDAKSPPHCAARSRPLRLTPEQSAT